MGRTCDTYGEKRNIYRVLEGKPEEKVLLGRPRGSWRMILKYIVKRWDEMAWAGLV
jgi:hypothetical protein